MQSIIVPLIALGWLNDARVLGFQPVYYPSSVVSPRQFTSVFSSTADVEEAAATVLSGPYVRCDIVFVNILHYTDGILYLIRSFLILSV